MVDHAHGHPDRVVGRPHEQPVSRDRVVVRPSSHQHDVVAVLGQPPADHAADGPGTHHDEPHGSTLAGANLLRRAGTR